MIIASKILNYGIKVNPLDKELKIRLNGQRNFFKNMGIPPPKKVVNLIFES
jgi:hypothetical protein